MTERERILAAIRGELPDRLPWAPRLEFWYRAQARNGALPDELRDLSLIELARKLGVGCYHVVPDFTELAGELDMIDYPLGILRQPTLVYDTVLEGVDRRIVRQGRETKVEYHTPVGLVQTATVWTEEMLDAGASVPWVSEHPVKEPRDLEVAGYIFSHIKVVPRLEGYLKRRGEIGDDGIVVAHTSDYAGPMQHIMAALMPLEKFFFALHDDPAGIERLAEQMEPFYQDVKRTAVDSPAEVVLLGSNYDDAITYPAFFRRYILPPLAGYAQVLHCKGKHLMTHTDGENRKLLKLYFEAGFDVADSVCPYPMTSCTLEEVREAFAGRIAIWGGIPSILLCRDSASDEQFRQSIDGLLERYGRQSRLILGVSDMVTADAELDRLHYITERVAQ